MTSRIDISASATITVLAGGSLSSLQTLPPGGIDITDPANGAITVNIIAANLAAAMSASGAGGATVSANANTLSLTGSAIQINAALATLQITEAGTATSDTLFLTAADPLALPGAAVIAVNIAPAGGPAFAAPPVSLALNPYSLTPLAGLIIGDPQVTGLNQMGQGARETLALTLSVASGVLLLPGFSELAGISATGLGSNFLILNFTSDQLSAVNSLLAGMEFAGPAGTSGLAYALRNVSGPLPAEVTSGNISLNISGTPGANGTITAGSQSLILGPVSLSGSSVFTSTTSDLGGISAPGGITIAPDAALRLPYNALSLGGTSLDFGTLSAATLSESGSLLITDGASFSGPVLLGNSGLIDFTGTLITDGAAQVNNELAISLGAGAVIQGDGTLIAGNFSESGRITGNGTIGAVGGGTLLIAAGSITGTTIDAAAGGVVILGPLDPLYGVFNATPLTIDNSVTLNFTGQPGLNPITGGYGDRLDQSGGVFVINGPEVFSGTIDGFTPGDRLIFPGLTNINVFNITSSGFDVAGQDAQGTTQSYIINAAAPSGTHFYAGTDNAGDAEISLRDAGTDVFIGGAAASLASIGAVAGIPQPVQGLDILLNSPTTLSLTVTLAVSHGSLRAGLLGPAASLTLTAANPTALNNALAGLVYTGTGQTDSLIVSSGSGPLNGLHAVTAIVPVSGGAATSLGTAAEGQIVTFATSSNSPITQAGTPGEIIVTANTTFADPLLINGISGTAILIDASGAGIFDAAAAVVTNADVIAGDASGPGTLDILGQNFRIGSNDNPANLVLATSTAAAGSAADIAGTLGISGSLVVGESAAATLDLSGNLGAASATIGPAGTLLAYGRATAAFGKILDSGTLFLIDHAVASASSLDIAGTLALGGTAILNIQSQAALEPGAALQIGPDATLTAVGFTQTGGGILDAGNLSLSTLISSGNITLSGGAITAASISLGGGATLSGNGFVESASLTNEGAIAAANGALVLDGNITNNGVIDIGVSASLDAVHGLTGGVINFTGSNAELTINDLAVFSAAIGNLAGHDVIDLVGIAPSLVSFANGSISAFDTAENQIGGFALSLQTAQPALQIISDNHGGALITLGGEMPCFARGTRLLTPSGYRPVESLKPGDPVITAAGDRRPIRWIGRRTLDLAGAKTAQPILIKPNAFGSGLPIRPLRLSPLHAVFMDGVLIPATHLVNGATIIREAAQAAITYYHVELDRHDVVLAEGLACETYLDTGNRGALYHEAGTRTPARKVCAKRITSGPKLAAIRRRLHNIALAAGFSLTYQPVLRALANGRTILPVISQKRGRRAAYFDLPPHCAQLILLSRSASPADTDPDSEDRRDLAICLRPMRGIRFGAGWYDRAPTDEGIWMGNAAGIMLAPAASLTLTMAAIIQKWRRPVDTIHHPS